MKQACGDGLVVGNAKGGCEGGQVFRGEHAMTDFIVGQFFAESPQVLFAMRHISNGHGIILFLQ